MFNDDGLGAAMAQSMTRDEAISAKNEVKRLEKRVERLEMVLAQVCSYLVLDLELRGEEVGSDDLPR